MTTLNLPIERKYFHLEINDEKFEQFYNHMQQQIDHSKSINPNYQRIFAKNYMAIQLRKDELIRRKIETPSSHLYFPAIGRTQPDFSFSLIFFKKIITRTQEDNYVRIILHLLNVFFIWFDIGVLDLYAYLYAHLLRIKFLVCCEFV